MRLLSLGESEDDFVDHLALVWRHAFADLLDQFQWGGLVCGGLLDTLRVATTRFPRAAFRAGFRQRSAMRLK
ncbi:hypothetical protein GCM10028811_22920 [Uliginosibacterium sediminicola]